jgi:hypothetical protein
LLSFWRTKPTESWRTPYWVWGAKDHSSLHDIFIFWWDFPPTSIAGFKAPTALQALEILGQGVF